MRGGSASWGGVRGAEASQGDICNVGSHGNLGPVERGAVLTSSEQRGARGGGGEAAQRVESGSNRALLGVTLPPKLDLSRPSPLGIQYSCTAAFARCQLLAGAPLPRPALLALPF